MFPRHIWSNYLRIFLVFCGFVVIGTLTFTKAEAHFDKWTIRDGIPQNSTYAILQTRDGYLWFTTLNGLVRYDGGGFTVFNKANSPGISSNRFTTLYEDEEGTLWIGTEGDGLTRLKNGIFTTFTTDVNSTYNRINSIAAAADNALWLLTEGGLARWENETIVPYMPEGRRVFNAESEPDRIIKHNIRNSGAAYANSDGLHIVKDGVLTTLSTSDGLSSLQINSLYKDGHGDLWIGTAEGNLNQLRDGQITVLTHADGLPKGDMTFTAVSEDHKGNLWFAVLGTPGVFRLRQGVLGHYGPKDGFSGRRVESIYEDREGSVWFGTIDGGLNRFKDEAITAFSTDDGLFSNNAYPIFQDSKGTVWVGTWPGLNKLENSRFTPFTKAEGLTSQTITALYEDGEGYLWIGAYGGLDRYKNGKFQAVKEFSNLDYGAVLSIHQDRRGRFWFGTIKGLYKFEKGVLEHFTTNEGLPHPQVIAIHEDKSGSLWFGTRGGLARLVEGELTTFSVMKELAGDHVRSLYEDEFGALWVGTYDSGLYRYKDARFVSYTMREGLFDNGVFQILDDGRGNFWMSSNRGVYRANRQELNDFADGKIKAITSVGYGTSDGMLSAECNGGSQPAGAKMSDGRLWFPTQGGVVIIDPEAIQTNPLPPPVVIQSVMIGDQKADVTDGHLTLEPGQELFNVSYAGLSFIKPDQVRFKYKLEGLDTDWVDAAGRRQANYSYVPPGEYTFRVIAANSDNVWNEQGAFLQIVIKPPFWRTWWFIMIAFGCVGFLMFSAYRYRVSQLTQAQKAQETFSRQLLHSQEQERQRIAGELHDGLGQSLLIIKNRAFLAKSAMEDKETAEEQIDEISSAATHAIDEVREIAHNLRPYQLDRFGLTKTLEAILNQASRASDIDFTSQIENVDNIFSKEAETSIYRIVQESVNNIIKHSRASQANLMIKVEGSKLILQIKDNGDGIAPDKEAEGRSGKGGFGLIGMSERVRMLGGMLSVNSVPGDGVLIDIRLNI